MLTAEEIWTLSKDAGLMAGGRVLKFTLALALPYDFRSRPTEDALRLVATGIWKTLDRTLQQDLGMTLEEVRSLVY